MSGESDHYTFTVAAEGKHSWSSRMKDRFRQEPTLLRPSAGNRYCTIFRAPKSQEESNPNAYKPHVVSIGPYHHGKEQLKMMEQHKARVFSTLLDRTSDDDDCAGLDDYFRAVAMLETDIRDSYSEDLNCESADLIEMMVLDACFIIELFRVGSFSTTMITEYEDDPLFLTNWIVAALMIDLLLIENQIPFFVLEEIHALSRSSGDGNRSINELGLMFFNRTLQRPEKYLRTYFRFPNIKHLLDLFRLCLVGLSILDRPSQEVKIDEELLQLTPSVNHLLLLGIKFEPRKSENLISVVFDHGVLRIPPLNLDLLTTSFFQNCVAYEQSYHHCTKHVSTYVVLMSGLMGSVADAAFLSQCGIISNLLGPEKEVARFFCGVAKDVQFDIKECYLAELFAKVTWYRRSKWRMWWAGTKREYFGSPWSFISAAAASILIVLTVIQAFFTVFTYYDPKK
ncbi:hypothetical protein ACJRO7_000823 [Eucalyptus globulus]|uniref:Uncharacterized protein n=1 Tax=Eucalyptus globulus TaxID=34317 RepID=A0ABD3LPV2_EUCGL